MLKMMSTRRRAAAVGVAVAFGAAALPATSSAVTCRAFTKKDITMSVDSNINAFMRRHVESAASQWSAPTSVNMLWARSANTADIRVHMIDIQNWPFYRGPDEWGYATWPCGAAGGGKGQSHVYLDTQVAGFLTIGKADVRARSLASHELGHALGLDHNLTVSGKCDDGTPRPTTVMYRRILLMGSTDICGHYKPATDDINAINALYK